MNHMIREGINEYPGDNATSEQFFVALRSMLIMKKKVLREILLCLIESLEVVVRSSVYYIQEVRIKFVKKIIFFY